MVNGLVLNGTALLGDAGNGWSGRINFARSQTLGGNGTVVFEPSGTSYLHLQNSGTVLTVGSGITLRGQSALIDGDQNTAMVNAGTISVDTNSATINIAVVLSNQGTARAINGGTLSLSGGCTNLGVLNVAAASTLTLGGAWVNSGSINATNATVNLSGSWTNAGAINAANSTVVSAQPFSDQGTVSALQGTLSFTSRLTLSGGILNFRSDWPIEFRAGHCFRHRQSRRNFERESAGWLRAGSWSSFPVMTYGSCSGAFSNFTLPSTWLWVVNQGATSLTLGTLLTDPTKPRHDRRGAGANGLYQWTIGDAHRQALSLVPVRRSGMTAAPPIRASSPRVLGAASAPDFTNTVPLRSS